MKMLFSAIFAIAMLFPAVTLADTQVLQSKNETYPIKITAVHLSRVDLVGKTIKEPMPDEMRATGKEVADEFIGQLKKDLQAAGIIVVDSGNEGSINAVIKLSYVDGFTKKLAVFLMLGPEGAARGGVASAQGLMGGTRLRLVGMVSSNIAEAMPKLVVTAAISPQAANVPTAESAVKKEN